MATNVLKAERFDAGEALALAFQLIRERFLQLSALALLLLVLPGVVVEALQPDAIRTAGNASFSAASLSAGYFGIAGMIGLAFVVIGYGALTHALVSKDKPGIAESALAGLRRAPPLAGVLVLMYFAVGFGMVILLVPGLILLTMWLVVMPVVVAERRGVFGSFGRSRGLTKGSRWPVFAILIGLFVLYILQIGGAALVMGGLDAASAARLGSLTAGGLAYRLGSLVIGVLVVAVISAVYLELVRIRDGQGGESLAAIFE